MTNDALYSETRLVETIRESVKARLTGSNEPEVLDSEPSRRFSVGVLNANSTDDRAAGAVLRRPDSLGFYVRLRNDCGETFSIRIGFSIYYRVRPSFGEQTGQAVGSLPQDEEIAAIPKYRRIDKVVDGFVKVSDEKGTGPTIDCEAINGAVSTAIAEARVSVSQDSETWPSPSFKLVGRHLCSEAAYEAAFAAAAATPVPEWKLALRTTVASSGRGRRLTILLTNHSNPLEFRMAWHSPEIFGASLELRGQAMCFLSEPFSPVRNDYRYDAPTWGKGINTVLMVNNAEGRAWTEHLPTFHQPRTQSRTGLEHATDTAALAQETNLERLHEVIQWLQQYLSEWESDIASSRQTEPALCAMQRDLEAYKDEVRRVSQGLDTLHQDPRLRRAFCLMNRTFAEARLTNWRLFQVAYVLTMMPSLFAREHLDTQWAVNEQSEADVLWFPTGGGKTEAFLAVVVVALFYDRLRGKLRGITAWLRYPLRMLSVQQLQRLITIVDRAETVRCDDPDLKYEGDPFSVGYYVGERNAPNDLTFPGRGENTIDRLFAESKRHTDGLIRYRVLSRCPKCNSESIRLDVDKEAVRLRHVCNDCGYEPRLYISDSEIYRYLPAVLVGTVDRLARAGQTDRFSAFFTGPTGRCPVHGYTTFGECVESGVCREKIVPVARERDPSPSLLLQDELHLLSESLGTYDAHYEGLVDLLARSFGSGMPPKRIAATATMEGMEQHVYHLYVRHGRCFPTKGRGIYDSAYVELDPSCATARLYCGVLPSGRDADDVSNTIAEHLCHLASQRSTALPEESNYDFLLVYVNEKNTAGDIRSVWKDDFSVQVLTGDKTLDEVRQVIARVESDGTRPREERLQAVIATSVVSHGVDLARLNQMVVVGLPRSVAEYIQASSRAGRTHTGLVFAVFRWQNRRNVSMYEHFFETHERLYQLVQPVPVNRVSISSLERTCTGLLASVVYNLFGPRLYESRKRRLNSAHGVMQALDAKDLIESEIADAVSTAYFAGFTMAESYRQQLVDTLLKIIRNQLRYLPTKPDWTFHARLDPKPVSSLREVGEQIRFGMSPRDGFTAKLLGQAREEN